MRSPLDPIAQTLGKRTLMQEHTTCMNTQRLEWQRFWAIPPSYRSTNYIGFRFTTRLGPPRGSGASLCISKPLALAVQSIGPLTLPFVSNLSHQDLFMEYPQQRRLNMISTSFTFIPYLEHQ
ncbi:hypothetical protein ABVK25_007827 [Lepraria finkii]|uniref:Uncharacterized protein n=1 Tax=Lepraria finkii TaxID=1340010 RepID=A0ABR4B1Y4_9LECA